MSNTIISVVIFVIGLIISTIIIYIVTRLFGDKKGIKTAFVAAIFGAIIYSIVGFILGNGFLAAIAGGIVWLLTLRALYDIGWLRAILIAIFIWIVVTVVGVLLPTTPRLL